MVADMELDRVDDMEVDKLAYNVADMVADMMADMEVDMVADMVANKVADMVADMFKTKCIKPETKCIGPKLFGAKCTRLACFLFKFCEFIFIDEIIPIGRACNCF